MDEFIEKTFSVGILIYGLSHFLQAKRWGKIFIDLTRGRTGPIYFWFFDSASRIIYCHRSQYMGLGFSCYYYCMRLGYGD